MSIDADRYGDPYTRTGRTAGQEPADLAAAPSGADPSQAAIRLLEKTAHETDQWRAEAKSEAAAILAQARKESAALVQTAREEAERLVASAKAEAAETTNDARVEAYRVREKITAQRKSHDEDVARLQQLAAEHRQRLRHHLTEMLEQVDAAPGQSVSSTPSR